MALVMKESGADAIFNNMGVDATGQAFNSIVAVEQYKGAEMNPLVNAGAIAALMYAYGHIKNNPEQATDIYTEQCSVSVNAQDLATMAAKR